MDEDKKLYIGHITVPVPNIDEIKSRLVNFGITIVPRYSNDNWYCLIFPIETSTEAMGEKFKITLPSGFILEYIPPKFNSDKKIDIDEYARLPQVTFYERNMR